MPSDKSRKPNAFYAWARSQGLGVVCGFSTVILLAIGSLVIAATRDGDSKGIALDDITHFFDKPSWTHTWFYLLLPVMSIYGLNILLATWHSASTKWRAGVRKVSAYAPAVMHVAFLVAMLAHLVGGVYSAEKGMLHVGPQWGPAGEGRSARVTTMKVELLPTGRTKQVEAVVEIRHEDGNTEQQLLEYNAPVSWNLGSELWLLTKFEQLPGAANIMGSTGVCRLLPNESCTLDGVILTMLAITRPGPQGQPSFARVRVAPRPGAGQSVASTPVELWLQPGKPESPFKGTQFLLGEVEKTGRVLLRRRIAAGNSWALLAALLLTVSVLMMWRRLLRPSAWRPSSHADEFG